MPSWRARPVMATGIGARRNGYGDVTDLPHLGTVVGFRSPEAKDLA